MSKKGAWAQAAACSFRVAGCSLRKYMRSTNFYVLVFYTLLFWYLFDWNIKSFAAVSSYGVTPYLLPLFFSDGVFQLYGLLLLALVTCGAPFLDESSLFSIQRTGRFAWTLGQMMFIVCANLFYQAVMIAVQIVTMLPYVTLSGKWGSVIYTVGNTPDVLYEYSGFGSYSPTVILGMGAMEAMFKQVILCALFGSAIGAAVFLVNGLLRCSIGAVLAAGGVLLALYLNEADLIWGISVSRFFPYLWIDLEYYIDETYDFGSNVFLLCVMFLSLAVVDCVCVKKEWIQTTS